MYDYDNDVDHDQEYRDQVKHEIKCHYEHTMLNVMYWRLGVKLKATPWRYIWHRRDGFEISYGVYTQTEARQRLEESTRRHSHDIEWAMKQPAPRYAK